MSLVRRIVNLRTRSKVNREIEEEIHAHMQMREEDNRAAGMSPPEARRDAVDGLALAGEIDAIADDRERAHVGPCHGGSARASFRRSLWSAWSRKVGGPPATCQERCPGGLPPHRGW